MAKVPRVRPHSGLTRSFEALNLAFCKDMAAKTVADHFGLGDDRVRRTVSHYVAAAVALEDCGDVRSVGIDETSAANGRAHVTLAKDFDRGRVIFASAGRDREAIGRFATHLWSHGGDPLSVRKACIDMSPAFISGVAEHFPNARVIFDKFHIMKLVNDAVNLVRRVEQKIWKAALKKTRFLLLRNREDLSDANSERMERLSKMKLKTGLDCEKKEKLRWIFSSGLTREEGEPECMFKLRVVTIQR